MLSKMRWPSRPAAMSAVNRKVSVSLTVHEFRGITLFPEDGENANCYVDVKWKGPKPSSPFLLRKSLKRGRTELKPAGDVLLWDDEFLNECVLVQSVKGNGQQQEASFQSWEVHLVLRKVTGTAIDKPVTVGTVVLDLANFLSLAGTTSKTEVFHVSKGEGGPEAVGSLMVSLHFEDVGDDVESMESQPVRAFSVGSAASSSPIVSRNQSHKEKAKPLPLLDTEEDEHLEKNEVTEKLLAEKDKMLSRPLSGRFALTNFLSRGKGSVKESAGYSGSQKQLLDALDLSVSNPYAGDETEDDSCDGDDSLRYGRIAGVNVAVLNDLPIPALIPIPGHGDSVEGASANPSISSSSENGMQLTESSSSSDDENLGVSTSSSSLSSHTSSLHQTQQSRRFFGMSLSFTSSTKPLALESLVSGSNNATPQAEQDSLSDSEEGPSARPGVGVGGGLSLKIPGGGGGWAIMGKRKLGNRSPKSMEEPLLNKAYGEDGGDEIDWDRRKAEEAEAEHPLHLQKLSRKAHSKSVNDLFSSIFGEAFSVGRWETKDVWSREGSVKLTTDVFFAGIDQCHEKASGEGACANLVVLVAEWFLSHPSSMPTKAEFADIIREGSAEWRKLCDVDTYKTRFADKHFDLETVVEHRNARLQLASERSFVGFFRPSLKGEEKKISESLSFLEDAMSFDGIWQEVSRGGPAVYIISWNDHFFVLVVQAGACYIVDTLGERLHEGCKEAYILRFDSSTSLSRVTEQVRNQDAQEDSKPASSHECKDECKAEGGEVPMANTAAEEASESRPPNSNTGEEEPCRDLPSEERKEEPPCDPMSPMGLCGQFIKDFFAALPLSELEKDVEKGLLGGVPLHRRLQVEFHFTQLSSAK